MDGEPAEVDATGRGNSGKRAVGGGGRGGVEGGEREIWPRGRQKGQRDRPTRERDTKSMNKKRRNRRKGAIHGTGERASGNDP